MSFIWDAYFVNKALEFWLHLKELKEQNILEALFQTSYMYHEVHDRSCDRS